MTTSNFHTYSGRCHCGAIGYEYRSQQQPDNWPYRACQCSFCRSHDVISTSDPAGFLEFKASNRDALQRYRFGLETADFLLCRHCGVYIGASIATPEGNFGIINIRALTDPEAIPPTVAPARYGGEDKAARIARRKAKWTPVTSTPY